MTTQKVSQGLEGLCEPRSSHRSTRRCPLCCNTGEQGHGQGCWYHPANIIARQNQAAEAQQSEAVSPRGRFFALWSEHGFPRDEGYSRYVVGKLLTEYHRRKNKDALLVTVDGRRALTDQEWAICADRLPFYRQELDSRGIRPGAEEDYDPFPEAAEG